MSISCEAIVSVSAMVQAAVTHRGRHKSTKSCGGVAPGLIVRTRRKSSWTFVWGSTKGVIISNNEDDQVL